MIKQNTKVLVQASTCKLFHTSFELEKPSETVLVQPQTSGSYSALAPTSNSYSVSAQTLQGKGR